MPIIWNQVTWYSKWAAMLVFIVALPILAFVIGVKYEQARQANMPILMNSNGTITIDDTNNDPKQDVEIGETKDMTLGVGETGSFGDIKVTFNEFVQDSRCPVDVQCIQAGAVTVNVTYDVGGTKKTLNMPSDEVPQEYMGYEISIIGVKPDRKSQVEIPPKNYVITFKVEKVR